ncbi:response regulator [Mangrovimonas sp. TPBH4]|uniref:response regulator n=1 Tax=Mangrovimonas sp. TPBH4 TaxID=1645914 RepID=UPI0006B69FDC|nr:response regulator [Mangrovimonas sp. TPBH4]
MKNQNPTVFIVDDNPFITESLSDYLAAQYGGFNIKSFTTGEACLKNIHKNPDAIVLDYYLNSKEKNAANGINILREIKKQDKNLPVIMLSSQKSYGTASQTIMYGATHYVMKGQAAYNEIYELLKANV